MRRNFFIVFPVMIFTALFSGALYARQVQLNAALSHSYLLEGEKRNL